MKSFILAEMGNFYHSDKEKKSGGMKVIKRIMHMGSNESDNLMTKEHVECINKDLELLWKIPTQKGIPENVKIAASKAIPEILSSDL